MSDILNKLSNKTTSPNNENTIVLSMLMEIKQMINDNMKPMNDKIDKLNKNFENEAKNAEKQIIRKRHINNKLTKPNPRESGQNCIGINCNKTVKGSGGTAILVRKSLNFKIQNLNIINDRMCGVKLCSDKYYDICLICVLLPSTNFSSEVYMNYIDELCTCYDMYSEDCTTIVGGDCNVDLTSISTSGKLTCFSNFLNDRNLCPAPLLQGRVGPKYTFRSKDLTKRSLLDYICVPEYLSNDILLFRG
ncbi:unnamed protein product [Mytilus edulis]|uniref:Endonuclease/exonuclease/phosphatase domain-containing protein n=1 Tax=Mytilus edulis TaxID=6550 RepID=A0A8S3UDN3_MYTED|nr:unnamed protein product [Mytilus edulis]